MHDSSLVFPPEHRGRRVFGGHGLPTTIRSGWWPGIDAPELDEADRGGHGLASTAWDTAIFALMLFQGGRYGDRRVLSAAASAMPRDQLGPSPAKLLAWINESTGVRSDLEFGGGGYGYGVFLAARGDWFIANGSLTSGLAYGHAGNGGAYWWVDPEHELVGVYLSIMANVRRGIGVLNSDLFQNVVHSAIMG